MKIADSIYQSIQKYLSDRTDYNLTDVINKIEKFTERWQLSQLNFMEKDAYGLLFTCISAVYGESVLKICLSEPEFETGVNCILSYNGKGYVKIHAYDLTDYILLMEHVVPGNLMWEIEDYRERAKIFAELVKDLPVLWDFNDKYPSYRTWMEELRVKLVNLGDREDVMFYLDKALEIYDELKQTYNKKCLLHGDLHQENMLLNSKGGYTIIDPKGVVDDPVMETARYLMNESSLETEKLREIISIISSIINIPEKDVAKSMFIDAALGQGWTFDTPFSDPNKFAKEKQEALNLCAKVYGLL